MHWNCPCLEWVVRLRVQRSGVRILLGHRYKCYRLYVAPRELPPISSKTTRSFLPPRQTFGKLPLVLWSCCTLGTPNIIVYHFASPSSYHIGAFQRPVVTPTIGQPSLLDVSPARSVPKQQELTSPPR